MESLSKKSDGTEFVSIGIGTNLGDRANNIRQAVEALRNNSNITIVKSSEIIETEPWGNINQPSFLNSIIVVTTSLSPIELLNYLKSLESKSGRVKSEHWGPRIIDLDILLFGKRVVQDKKLVIPHKEITNRNFILKQLIDLDPELMEPVTNIRYVDYLKKLKEDY
ncbi:MAG: 2-amino-4-hydroxy-6-hydroxymethyldihydropteridine diphosphokinase [Deltaproteobacteria bacterium]|nr:2-amino-4-hydroxy-6-hydroxymethyldihydropteridine diphosphokinase [Deltaproteobacteria bacterium]